MRKITTKKSTVKVAPKKPTVKITLNPKPKLKIVIKKKKV